MTIPLRHLIPQAFFKKVWAKRFGLDNLSIRTRLVFLVVLLIVLFGYIAVQAHNTIIAYIEKREKVDLRDEAMNARASFEKLLSRAVSLISEDARRQVETEGAARKWLSSADEIDIKVRRIARYNNFEDLLEKCRPHEEVDKGKVSQDIIRPELLHRIVEDHLVASKVHFASDKVQHHSYWSNLFWSIVDESRKSEDEQSARIQVLVRDDLRESGTGETPRRTVNENPIWFYEVDLTRPLAENILGSVRSYGILVNPAFAVGSTPDRDAQSMELAYIPLLDGWPGKDPSPQETQGNSARTEKRRFTLGPKLRQAINRHDENIQEQIRDRLEVENFSFQFPPSEDLPEGGDSGISIRDLLEYEESHILDSIPWTCKSGPLISTRVQDLVRKLKNDTSTHPKPDAPLNKVFVEKGQTPRIWLRGGSRQELEQLKKSVSQLYAKTSRDKTQYGELEWESQTSMDNLVLSISSVRAPGVAPNSQPILYMVRAVSLEEIRNSAQEGLSPLIYWGILICVLGLCLTVTLAFRITKPLQQITQVVRQIQEIDLNSDTPETEDHFRELLTNLPRSRKDEVGAISQQLAKTFESILDKNKKISFQLERSNKAELDRRVAEEANDAKTQFLAMISHDMRQSMNVMFGHLSMLQEQCSNSEQTQDVQAVFMSAKKIRYLIDDVLDYQRFLTGDVHVESREFNVEQMLKSVVRIYESNAEENGNRIDFESHYHQSIFSDEAKIERMVGNLLSNACKFTKRGSIKVLLEQASPSEIRISVRDSGRGMNKEQREKVFKIQNTVKTNGNRDGTGLGLYICKRLSASLSGDITFESTEGKGTRFEIRLPIQFISGKLPIHQQPKSASDEQAVMLIIDDAREARDAIRKAVESHSREAFKILEASSGQQGLRIARENGPSIITLDVNMPDMSGFKVLQELRADPITARIPVVMVTVQTDTRKAAVLGANGFLKKPFDRSQLWREIDRTLRDVGDGLVLLVDDDEACRRELSKMLSTRGIRNATARDGEDALDRIHDEIPSLFIIDLLMPRMDGFALIEKLRAMPETKDTPILVLSALAPDTEEMSKLDPLIQKFFSKENMDLQELIQEIDRIIRSDSKRVAFQR